MHAEALDADGAAADAPVVAPRGCASLRARLAAGLFLTVAVIWSGWFSCQWLQYNVDQTGTHDRMLQEAARGILHTLPRGFEAIAGEPAYPPPKELNGDATPPVFRLVYQVWADGRLVMRSPGAPTAAPIRPCTDERVGDVRLAGLAWRALCVRSPDARVEVMLAKPASAMQQELSRWFWSSLSTAALILVGMGVVLWLVIRWSLQPVERVRTTLLARDLHDATPLPTDGVPAELAPLLDAFNRTLARLHRALQGERRFLADAAHELRTPLAALRAQADVARRSPSSEAAREALDRLGDGIDRCARLSAQMLDMARLEHGGPGGPAEAVELSRLVDVVARDFEDLAARRGQRIELELSGAPVQGHTDELGILVRNLIDNALRYGQDHGRVRLLCGFEETAGHRHVVLRVGDDGPGVPDGERRRIFDRFYRAAGRRDTGCGIGLSLVWQVAALHGARIETSAGLDGRGLEVAVHFPAHGPAAAATTVPTAPATSARRWPAAHLTG